MKPSIYEIASVGNGVLYVMPRPSAEWLDDDMREFRTCGVDRIISLLEAEEARELGLASEQDCARSHGMDFLQFPIPDRGLPDVTAFGSLVTSCYEALHGGMTIAVHCRAGIGRSGLLASCVLVTDGMTAEQAIGTVRAARGVPIPDTAEQRDFILGYVR